MQKTPPLKRAAQYVRMSTDQQQYSTINQKTAIAVWAEARGIEIVATYEDAGKSGLTLSGRPALRQLIADALAGPELFDTILVYDVSRWGRFQDADESAHLEYLCRSAGVTVHYCAEQFTNDGSTMANLYKVMKRTLAAEYSRELSEKVKIGKARLASYGFRQGSVPGFGFRRRLLDQHGTDKGLLAPGEHKRLTTDRVILTLGPPKELATVRWIYVAYVDRGISIIEICNILNARGIANAGRRWTKRSVYTLLSSPKYAGDNTWGMTACTLGKKSSRPREQWSTRTGDIKPIVSRELFDRAQAKRQSFLRKWTDEQLLKELRRIHQLEGRVSCQLLRKYRLHNKIFKNHFGSLANAYQLGGIEMQSEKHESDWWQTHRQTRVQICNLLITQIKTAGAEVAWPHIRRDAVVNSEVRIQLSTASPTLFPRTRQKGWQLRLEGCDADLTIFAILSNELKAQSYFLLPLREAKGGFKFREVNEACLECFRSNDLSEIASLFRRIPLDAAALPREPVMHANSLELSPFPATVLRAARSSRKRPDGHRLHNSFEDAFSYLRRKRHFIEKAAFTHTSMRRLSSELREILRRPGVIDRLRSAAVCTAPAALIEDGAVDPAPHTAVAKQFGPRNEEGLCQATVEIFAGRKLARGTVACLAMMKDRCQFEAAIEMMSEQRCSYELARLLLALARVEDTVVPRHRRSPSVADTTMKLLRADADHVRSLSCQAIRQYPQEAIALVSLIGFGRRLAEAPELASFRKLAGRRAVAALRATLSEIREWREAPSLTPFARGRAL